MAQKIRASALLEMIEDPDVPEKDIAPYLKLERSVLLPDQPTVVFDDSRVDMEGELLAPAMASFRIRHGDARRRQRRYRERIEAGWSGIRLLSEGDSWFQYPILLQDVIDWLDDPYAIYCVAAAGDTLQNMRAGLPALKRLIAQERFHGFLISGGGNDVLVGEKLGNLLRGYNSDFETAEAYVIKSRLRRQIRAVLGIYAELFSELTRAFPSLRVFCHGYDKAQPKFGGEYMTPVMDEKEIPEEFRAEIVEIMVDAFNEAMKRLAAKSEFDGRVIFVDCRDSVGRSWFDEIHPTNAGFKRVAKRFRKAIDN